MADVVGDIPETTRVVYDGRVSAKCRRTCEAGECRHPRTVDGCGGCCGCLGGCAEGYEEQLAEADHGGRDIPEEMVDKVARSLADKIDQAMPTPGYLRAYARDALSAALAGRTVVDLPERDGVDETGSWWNHDHGAVIADALSTADTAQYLRRRAGALLAAAHHIEQRLRASGSGGGQ